MKNRKPSIHSIHFDIFIMLLMPLKPLSLNLEHFKKLNLLMSDLK
jgi:hypothetical protein